MNNNTLFGAEENWLTDMGAMVGDTVIVRDKDLFTELYDCSWMELLLFVVTGRRFSAEKVELFDRLWTLSTSYPDPRLWNNRIAALAGCARSTGVLGIAGATAVSEANVYGKQADMRAHDFITRMKANCDAGIDVESAVLAELKEKRSIGGFGHPLVSRDPRITPVLQLLDDLGVGRGPCVNLALKIETILQNSRYKMSMNVSGLVAAICLDQGLSRREYYGYALVAFSVGFLACYFDALNHPEGSFFPLRCARIDYKGVEPRKWG